MKKFFRKVLPLLLVFALTANVIVLPPSRVEAAADPDQEIEVLLAADTASNNLELTGLSDRLKQTLNTKYDVPMERIHISAVDSSTVSSGFAWNRVDHTNNAARVSNTVSSLVTKFTEKTGSDTYGQYSRNEHDYHIDLAGNTINFYGYGKGAPKDFLFAPNSNADNKVFRFTLDEGAVNYHSGEGAGFLFNASYTVTTNAGGTVTGRRLSGYAVLITGTEATNDTEYVTLYRLDNIDAVQFSTSADTVTSGGALDNSATTLNIPVDKWGGKVTLLKKVEKTQPSQGTKRFLKLAASPEKVSFYQFTSDTYATVGDKWIDNYTLPTVYNSFGFGPIASYRGHDCSRMTQFIFSDLNMSEDTSTTFTDLVKNTTWNYPGSFRVIANVDNDGVPDFGKKADLSTILYYMMINDTHYVGWGVNNALNPFIGSYGTVKDQSDGFVARNNGKGTFINRSDSDYDTLDEGTDALADYIADKLGLIPKIAKPVIQTAFDNNFLSNGNVTCSTPTVKTSLGNDVKAYNWKVLNVESGVWEDKGTSTSTSMTFPQNTYSIVALRIQDPTLPELYSWSDYEVVYIANDTNAPPVALFTLDKYELMPGSSASDMTAQAVDASYHPAGESLTAWEWKVYNSTLVEQTGLASNAQNPSFDFSGKPAGKYTIKLRAQKGGTWSAYYSQNVNVFAESSSISIVRTSPAGTGNVNYTGASQSFSFDISSSGGELSAYRIIKVPSAGGSRITGDWVSISGSTASGSSSVSGGSYEILVQAKDVDGNIKTQSLGVFAHGAVPEVSTIRVNSTSDKTATVYGSVYSSLGSDVTVRGVEYKADSDSDYTVVNASASGIGDFSVDLTDLAPGTAYTVRAFATNSSGTGYGDILHFTTLTVPIVSTSIADNDIGSISAIVHGNVSSTGGADTLTRGIEYKKYTDTSYSAVYEENAGTGDFSFEITDLTPRTKYVARAFASNSVGTGYGQEIEFTTNSRSLTAAPVFVNEEELDGKTLILTIAGDSFKESIDSSDIIFSNAPEGLTVTEAVYGDASSCSIKLKFDGVYNDRYIPDFNITVKGSGLLRDKDITSNNVLIKNITPPVITLNGDKSTVIKKGGKYTDSGATAEDAGKTIQVNTVSNVNTDVPGTYTVTYTATDASGNTATATRTVIVAPEKQVLTVKGTVTGKADGKPLPGVELKLYDLGGKLIKETTADQNGKYVFTEVIEDLYRLVAEKQGSYQEIARGINVSSLNASYNDAGKSITEDIEMYKLLLQLKATPSSLIGDGIQQSQLAATVLDENNAPKAGIQVHFTAALGTFPQGADARTDENGKAQVTFRSAVLSGVESRVIPIEATVNDNVNNLYATARIYMTFEPSAVKGIVTDNATHQPIAGARVIVSKDFDDDGVVDFYCETVTDADGKYYMPVPVGNTSYDVQIVQTLTIGGSQVDVVYNQTGEVGQITGHGNEDYAAKNTATGIIALKGTNNTTQLLTDYSKFELAVSDGSGNAVNGNSISPATGVFKTEGLEVGRQYKVDVYYQLAPGVKLKVGTANVSLQENGEVSICQILIDPYGTITDADTGQPIKDVNVRLYYADTQRNRNSSKTPNTLVPLPAVNNWPPANNANPQYSNAAGLYSFMVFPQSDYYIVAQRAGYYTYTSPTIQVGDDIVRHDIVMQRQPSSSKDNDKDTTTKTTVAPTPAVSPTPPSDTASDKLAVNEGGVLNGNIGAGNGSGYELYDDSSGMPVGTVIIDEDGTWHYIPKDGFTGTDQFSVKITDSNGKQVIKTITVEVDKSAAAAYSNNGLVNALYADPMRSEEGSTVNGTIEYKNIGSKAIKNVSIALPVPQGMTAVKADGGTISKDKILWKLGELAAGKSGKVTFVIKSDKLPGDSKIVRMCSTIRGDSGEMNATNVSKLSVFIYSNEVEHKHNAYINGYPDGSVRPEGYITRAEVAAIFARITQAPDSAQGKGTFNDVDSKAWYSGYVEAVNTEGLMTGYSDGSFKPDRKITRAELAATIAKYYNIDSRNTVVFDRSFKDSQNHWAGNYLEEMSRYRIVNGYADGSFKPDAYITRAEVVTMVNNMLFRGPIEGMARDYTDLAKTHWAFGAIQEASVQHSSQYAGDGSEQAVQNKK